MAIGSYISVRILNVNGLNTPTKRHRLVEWIQNQDPYICCLQETRLRLRNTYRLKMRDWKRYSVQMEIKRKWKQKYLGQIDFKIKRDNEGQHIMIKG